MRIPFGKRLRGYAPEIHQAYDAEYRNEYEPRQRGEFVQQFVYSAGGVLAFSRLRDVADDPLADLIERIVVIHLKDHQGLLRPVGKTALDHKADRDLVALV